MASMMLVHQNDHPCWNVDVQIPGDKVMWITSLEVNNFFHLTVLETFSTLGNRIKPNIQIDYIPYYLENNALISSWNWQLKAL
jgi:hypothetical protein